MEFKRVSVIGLGYIGLPTAAMFASKKVEVIGVDVNQGAVDTINRGEIHIIEPDLDSVVRSTVAKGYLKATTTPEPADAFIIAVPTPFKEGNRPDLSYIESAAKAVASVLKKGDLVILESTSPVGATEKLATWLNEARPDLAIPLTSEDKCDVYIAHCPERVLPGKVMQELTSNDRVIGGITKKCAERSIALYKIFVKAECVVTNARTAEMAKLTENSFRDVNIAFANELSMVCDEQAINVWDLIGLANRHPRVNILQPGCGVGGHCIAVDPWFIVDSAPKTAKLIRAAREVNDRKSDWVEEKVLEAVEQSNSNTVICFGITFKPNIDDLRESPAMKITECLADKNLNVLVVEPNIQKLPGNLANSGCKLITLDEVSDYPLGVKVLLVGHNSFRDYRVSSIDNSDPSVIDFCGIYS